MSLISFSVNPQQSTTTLLGWDTVHDRLLPTPSPGISKAIIDIAS